MQTRRRRSRPRHTLPRLQAPWVLRSLSSADRVAVMAQWRATRAGVQHSLARLLNAGAPLPAVPPPAPAAASTADSHLPAAARNEVRPRPPVLCLAATAPQNASRRRAATVPHFRRATATLRLAGGPATTPPPGNRHQPPSTALNRPQVHVPDPMEVHQEAGRALAYAPNVAQGLGNRAGALLGAQKDGVLRELLEASGSAAAAGPVATAEEKAALDVLVR